MFQTAIFNGRQIQTTCLNSPIGGDGTYAQDRHAEDEISSKEECNRVHRSRISNDVADSVKCEWNPVRGAMERFLAVYQICFYVLRSV